MGGMTKQKLYRRLRKTTRLWMRPRYMNVPSPAPCHINVSGVGLHSRLGTGLAVPA